MALEKGEGIFGKFRNMHQGNEEESTFDIERALEKVDASFLDSLQPLIDGISASAEVTLDDHNLIDGRAKKLIASLKEKGDMVSEEQVEAVTDALKKYVFNAADAKRDIGV